MKKTMLILAAALTIGVGSYGVYATQETEIAVSDLLLDNLEALAQDEVKTTVDDYVITCSFKCNDGIGQCWIRKDADCFRTDRPSNYCQCCRGDDDKDNGI